MSIEELNKTRSEIPTEALVERARKWVSDLCRTGARAWSLRVPPDPENDPDMVFGELANRVEYWQKRCLAAENCIEKSPCDPDITKEQIEAHKQWEVSKKL